MIKLNSTLIEYLHVAYNNLNNTESNPHAGMMINEKNMQWIVPWYTSFYIKDLITSAEIVRIKTSFSNHKIAVHTF